ncbi:hypothetical protein [Sphingobacterium kyonggiense]|uniref:hypothetical protein n=1 Tax=Sphingobacterium kyonggiense TaxID=714075 RepID=UPI0031D22BBC
MAYYLNGLNGIVQAVDACNDHTVIGGIVPELYWLLVTSYRIRRVVIPPIGLTTPY